MSNDPTPAAGPTPPAADAIQATPPAGSATGIQTAPAPEAPAILLPPRSGGGPVSPERLGRTLARLDRALVVLVLLLAGLVAAFPVRNTDFWLHLAAARDWLHGKMALGSDPFSYTGTGSWVNHSWLYGVLAYGLYQTLGGPAVVVVKAALLVVVAALLLSVRRRGQSLWIPAVCTTLAVLAVSPRALMQPTVLSFVLLAATVALLMRREPREEPEDDRKRRAHAPVPWLGEPSDRPLWLLVPLFALWVNLDAWFFVGPLALALCLAGELLQAFFTSNTPAAPRPGNWRPLAAVLAAGVVACLLNPFGYHALNLPDEIGPAAVLAKLRDDELFRRILASPLQAEYLHHEGACVAGMAYFPLIAVGLLSFFLNTARWRWGRALLWGGFLVLSVWHARAIPFFAIVAGPVAALNLQEYAARRFGTAPATTGRLREWSPLGRVLSILAVFALLVLAWPGWLFGFPAEARRVGLTAEPPASLVKLARQLDDWQHDGKLSDDDHGLNLSPETTNVLAWLCQEHHERAFFDYRFGNYPPEVAEQYVKLRKMFSPSPRARGTRSLLDEATAWEPILREHGVSYVILYDPDALRFQFLRSRVTNAGTHLATAYQDGHSAVYEVFARPLKPEQNAYLAQLQRRGLPLPPLPPRGAAGRLAGEKGDDDWALAFRPKPEDRLKESAPRVPRPQSWYERFAFGPGPRSPEVADAATHLAHFEDTAFRWHYDRVMLPRASMTFAGLTAFAGGRSGSALSDAWLVGLQTIASTQWERPPVDIDENGFVVFSGRIAPLLLAVRDARRAIQRNPDDAEAYYQLGRAYALMTLETEERPFGRRMPLLAQLRQAQTIAALRNAVQLNPDLGMAHQLLAMLFGSSGYADLQLKHMGEYLRWVRRAAAAAGDSDEQINEQVQALEKQYKELEKRVKDDLNKYEVKSDKKNILEKAQIALGMGLGDKALEVLLESQDIEFGVEGAHLELDLLLRTGRLDVLREQVANKDEKVREQVASGLNSKVGVGVYEQYRFLLAAAEGDYKEADDFLAKAEEKTLTDPDMRQRLRQELRLEGKDPGSARDLDIRQLLAVGVARMIAEGMPRSAPVGWLARQRLQRELGVLPMHEVGLLELQHVAAPLQLTADYETLRGILQLEVGDIETAKGHFREALFFDKEKKGGAGDRVILDFSGLPAAYRYLNMIEGKE